MPRYVLLRHECPPEYRDGPHWDFMLEAEGELLTWSLAELPSAWRAVLGLPPSAQQEQAAVVAQPLGAHRLDYLEYEGPLSGDRGWVSRVAGGSFVWIEREAERTSVRFASGGLSGDAEIRRAVGEPWWVLEADV